MSALIRHMVVGPEGHGVVRHGLGLHAAAAALEARTAQEHGSAQGLESAHAPETVHELEHRLVRAAGVEQLPEQEDDAAGEAPPAVVHVSFTDALFGPDPEAAVDAVLRRRGPGLLSVAPHDVPQPEEGAERFARRQRAYRRLVGAADLVIAHSEHEAASLRELAAQAAGSGPATPVHVIPLPLEEPAPGAGEPSRGPSSAARPATVGVLGFVYPGKGIEDVIDQAPPRTRVRAVGGVAAGHQDDAAQLQERAAGRDTVLEITGYVPEAELAEELAAVDVPVCPHRHVSASGSLSTWIAHGRVPLVVDGPYMREIDERWPGRVMRCRRDELGARLRDLLADPTPTRAVQPPPQWGWGEVARAYAGVWAEALR